MEPYNRTTYKPAFRIGKWAGGGSSGFGVNTQTSFSNSIVGFTNPSWEQQVRDRYCATTTCSGSERTFRFGRAVMQDTREETTGPQKGVKTIYKFDGGADVGTFNICSSSYMAITASIENDALARFNSAISEVLVKAQGLTILAELPKLVHSIRNPFKALVNLSEGREKRLKRLAKKLRNRHLPNHIGRRRFTDAITDTWLETQYALKPAIHDIEDIASYITQRRLEVGVRYYPVRGHAIRREMTNPERIRADWALNRWYNFKATTKQVSARYHGIVEVKMPLDPVMGQKDFSRLGFSLSQVVPTLWEITPWSFLVDYFSNLGDVINSYCVPTGSLRWYNKTLRQENKGIVTFSPAMIRAFLSNFNIGSIDVAGNLFSIHQNVVGAGYTIKPDFCSEAWPTLEARKTWSRSGGVGVTLPRLNISFDLPSGMQFSNILALYMSRSRQRFSSSAF